MDKFKLDIVRQFVAAFQKGDLRRVRELFQKYPDYVGYSDITTVSWLHEAITYQQLDAARFLVSELGFDVNKVDSRGGTSPLEVAIRKKRLDIVQFLLDEGADPNIGRTLFGAINTEPETLGLTLAELLVKHGADVSCEFPWFDRKDLAYTPLSFAIAHGKTKIADYLRSLGATVPGERSKPVKAAATVSDEVIAYFKEHFGAVQPKSLLEIVPPRSVAIHVIPAGEDRKHITLFTTGLSEKAMKTPRGKDEYRHAELFIQVPAKWPLSADALTDPKYGWPIEWLRSIARYPGENKTWLGGAVTIIANGEPPEPLAPHLKFTSLLLLAEQNFVASDGRTIQLYRLTPLYSEERNLEIRQGIAALMNAFDKYDVSFVVDLKRRNVAKP